MTYTKEEIEARIHDVLIESGYNLESITILVMQIVEEELERQAETERERRECEEFARDEGNLSN